MELCTSHGVFNLQRRCPTSFHFRPALVRRALAPSLFHSSRVGLKSGGLRLKTVSLRAASEETSTETTEYAERIGGADINFNKSSSIEVVDREKLDAENARGDQSVEFELLDKLDVKIDTDSTIPILLYGGGALVSIWLASAVVEAIDAIPVFPKLMQVVGLAYTVWFTSRYLVFKESRDELAMKIAELKLKILGSEWN